MVDTESKIIELKEINKQLAEVITKDYIIACNKFGNKASQALKVIDGITYRMNHSALLATKDKKLIGMCLFKEIIDYGIKGVLEIKNIYVLPEYRRKKIARHLISGVYMLWGIKSFGTNALLLTSQDGESDEFRKLFLACGARESNYKNAMNLPLLYLGLTEQVKKIKLLGNSLDNLDRYIKEGRAVINSHKALLNIDMPEVNFDA